jgi:hypothetical protein
MVDARLGDGAGRLLGALCDGRAIMSSKIGAK